MSVSCPAFFMERRKYGPVKNQIRPIYRKYRSAAYGALYQAPDKCVKTAHKEQNGTIDEMTSSTVSL